MTIIKRSFNFIVILLLILTIFTGFAGAITGSMGNSKMILYPELNGGSIVIDRTILVRNVNDVVINVTLEADSNAKKFIDVVDKTFSLQPGEEKKARITIKIDEEGRYEGKVLVSFAPSQKDGPGIVLSSTIIVITEGNRISENNEEASSEEELGENISTKKELAAGEEKALDPKVMVIGGSSILLIVILAFLIGAMKKKSLKQKTSSGKRESKK